MFVPFDVVKGEDCAVPGWQLHDSLIKSDPIDYGHRIRILGALDDLNRGFAVFGRLFHPHSAFAKVHQHLIDRQPMEPGGKGRLATKTSNFSKELYENLLSEVFGLRDISGHSQTEGIDPAVVALVQLLEGVHITFGGLLCQGVIGWLCPGFGCGHVFNCSRQRRRSVDTTTLLFVRNDSHGPLYFNPSKNPFTPLRAAPIRARPARFPGFPQRGCDAALRSRRCLPRLEK